MRSALLRAIDGVATCGLEGVFGWEIARREVLGDVGGSLDDVAKSTIFLVDLADFAAVNEVYAAALGDHRPARSTIQVAALPAGARVEIEVWAHLPIDR